MKRIQQTWGLDGKLIHKGSERFLWLRISILLRRVMCFKVTLQTSLRRRERLSLRISHLCSVTVWDVIVVNDTYCTPRPFFCTRKFPDWESRFCVTCGWDTVRRTRPSPHDLLNLYQRRELLFYKHTLSRYLCVYFYTTLYSFLTRIPLHSFGSRLPFRDSSLSRPSSLDVRSLVNNI